MIFFSTQQIFFFIGYQQVAEEFLRGKGQSETIRCLIFKQEKHFKVHLPFYTFTETDFWDYLGEKGSSSSAGRREFVHFRMGFSCGCK